MLVLLIRYVYSPLADRILVPDNMINKRSTIQLRQTEVCLPMFDSHECPARVSRAR
jgi:hypothetical protein